MNRSLLLIISDFLLLSLLALARFDRPDEVREQVDGLRSSAVERSAQDDLLEVLELSLRNEEESRQNLAEELRDEEARRRKVEEEARDLELKRRQLEAAKAQLAREGRELAGQVEDAKKKILAKDREKERFLEDLKDSQASAAAERKRVRLLQEQMRARDEALNQSRIDLRVAQERRNAVEKERQLLATEVQIRDTEKRILEENLVAARSEIETVRFEKEAIHRQASRLVEGVNELAESSTALTEEIRQNQPASLNAIFDDFRGRRSIARFKAVQENGKVREFSVKTVFVTDGSQTFALLHASDSPFKRSVPLSRMRSVEGTVEVGERLFAVESVEMHFQDPRVLLIRVEGGSLQDEEISPYSVARDPLKFADAVLIANSEEYYGETGFRLEPGREPYLSMQNRLFSRLFGEFSPSVSDLVFAKTGELLGLMVNSRYCMIVDRFHAAGTILLGDRFSAADAVAAVDSIEAYVNRLPEELR